MTTWPAGWHIDYDGVVIKGTCWANLNGVSNPPPITQGETA